MRYTFWQSCIANQINLNILKRMQDQVLSTRVNYPCCHVNRNTLLVWASSSSSLTKIRAPLSQHFFDCRLLCTYFVQHSENRKLSVHFLPVFVLTTLNIIT